MSPLKGRALRLSYSHSHSGGGGAAAAGLNTSSEPLGASAALASAGGATGLSPPSFKNDLVAPQETDDWDGRVAVDALTVQAIKIEVLDVLGSPPVPASVYAVAQAVGGCPQVRLLHAHAHAAAPPPSEYDGNGDGAPGGGYGRGYGEEEETPAERSARRGAELSAALQSLGRRVGSVDRAVESWAEARAVLGSVLAFPDEMGRRREKLGTEGGEEEEEDEEDYDLDELEREQRDLEREGAGGNAFRIVPVLKNSGPTSTTSSTPTTTKRRSLAARVHRSTRRTLSKATTSAGRSLALAASRGQHHLTKAKYATMLRLADLEKMRKFKVLTSAVVPPPIPRSVVSLVQEEEEEEGRTFREDGDAAAEARAAAAEAAMAALTGIAKFDQLADQRLSEAEATSRSAVEAARQDAAIAAREQAEADALAAAAAEAAAQANRSATLLRDLTDDEAATVREAIYGLGRPDEIVATSDTDSVQRQSLHKLQPGVWLNDEVIHYFLLMLARRDEELAAKAGGGGGGGGGEKRKRCHFFKSFFITKLLDEAGGYNYKNVKRWSRKVPGKDIFALDKIFFPGKFSSHAWVPVMVSAYLCLL